MGCWYSSTAGKILRYNKTTRIFQLPLGHRTQNVDILVLNDRKISLASKRKYHPSPIPQRYLWGTKISLWILDYHTFSSLLNYFLVMSLHTVKYQVISIGSELLKAIVLISTICNTMIKKKRLNLVLSKDG